MNVRLQNAILPYHRLTVLESVYSITISNTTGKLFKQPFCNTYICLI